MQKECFVFLLCIVLLCIAYNMNKKVLTFDEMEIEKCTTYDSNIQYT